MLFVEEAIDEKSCNPSKSTRDIKKKNWALEKLPLNCILDEVWSFQSRLKIKYIFS